MPRCEVFGAGVPGQEPIQCLPGGRFPAGAIAFVEVGGEEGNDVQPGYRGGRGDVQIAAAVRAVPPLREPPAFFLVTTGPRIVRSAMLLSLCRVPDKDNYPDVAVTPMLLVPGGSVAGQGGALAAQCGIASEVFEESEELVRGRVAGPVLQSRFVT